MKGKKYLTHTGQYRLVYSQGGSWANSLLVLRALANGLGFSRYGFSVSRRVGGAVVRNRVKRLLREVMRHVPLQSGWDIVLIARPAAAGASYQTLEESVRSLLKRAHLLARDYEGASLNAN